MEQSWQLSERRIMWNLSRINNDIFIGSELCEIHTKRTTRTRYVLICVVLLVSTVTLPNLVYV